MTTPTTFDPVLNIARQSLYRFAALSLLDPRADAWEQLAALRDDLLLDEAAELIRGEPAARAASLALGERSLDQLNPRRVLDRLPLSRDGLNDQFEQTFGLLVTKACPPYETEYINAKFTFQRSQMMADISGFYRAFGLAISDRSPERHDHVVLELEFMAFLLGLERRACEQRAAGFPSASWSEISGQFADLPHENVPHNERSTICRDAQHRFLQDHLAWWAPTFCRLLARENPGGFYEAASDFLVALIPAERSLLEVAAPNRRAEPSELERPEECEGCHLGAV